MSGRRYLTPGDYETAAEQALGPAVWAYVAGGAGDDSTVLANEDAFRALWLRGRVLGTSGGAPSTETTIFDQTMPSPILLAPTSPQHLVHSEAEIATASAAAARGNVSVVSTDSYHPFDDVVRAGADRCWFQLYAYRSREDVVKTIRYAQNAGAKAIVLTVDAQHPARRLRAWRSGFSAPATLRFGTLGVLGLAGNAVPPDARIERLALHWSDLEWIRAAVTVPLLVKGVLHPQDAIRCLEHGADGIIVSNHGGRQLNSVLPSIVALREIVPAVAGACPVLLDGGIRSGTDVLKSLAAGADAVCIGRPCLWGLAVAGRAGVEDVIDLLAAELEAAMMQLGLSSLKEVTSDLLVDNRAAGM